MDDAENLDSVSELNVDTSGYLKDSVAGSTLHTNTCPDTLTIGNGAPLNLTGALGFHGDWGNLTETENTRDDFLLNDFLFHDVTGKPGDHKNTTMTSQTGGSYRNKPNTPISPQTGGCDVAQVAQVDVKQVALVATLAETVFDKNCPSDKGKEVIMHENSHSVDVKQFIMQDISNSDDVIQTNRNEARGTDRLIQINSRHQPDQSKSHSKKNTFLSWPRMSSRSHCDISTDVVRFTPEFGRALPRRAASVSACSPGHASSRNGKRLAKRLAAQLKRVQPQTGLAAAMSYLRRWIHTKSCREPLATAANEDAGRNAMRYCRPGTCEAAAACSKKWCLLNHRLVTSGEVNEAFTGTEKTELLAKRIKLYELIFQYMDILSAIFETRDDKHKHENSFRDLNKSYLTYKEVFSSDVGVDKVLFEVNNKDDQHYHLSPGQNEGLRGQKQDHQGQKQNQQSQKQDQLGQKQDQQSQKQDQQDKKQNQQSQKQGHKGQKQSHQSLKQVHQQTVKNSQFNSRVTGQAHSPTLLEISWKSESFQSKGHEGHVCVQEDKMCSTEREQDDKMCSTEREQDDKMCSTEREQDDKMCSTERKQDDKMCSTEREQEDKMRSTEREQDDKMCSTEREQDDKMCSTEREQDDKMCSTEREQDDKMCSTEREQDDKMCSTEHEQDDKMSCSTEHEQECQDNKPSMSRGKKWKRDKKRQRWGDHKFDSRQSISFCKVPSERKESNNPATFGVRYEVHQYPNEVHQYPKDIQRQPLNSILAQQREHKQVKAGRAKCGREGQMRQKSIFESHELATEQRNLSTDSKHLLSPEPRSLSTDRKHVLSSESRSLSTDRKLVPSSEPRSLSTDRKHLLSSEPRSLSTDRKLVPSSEPRSLSTDRKHLLSSEPRSLSTDRKLVPSSEPRSLSTDRKYVLSSEPRSLSTDRKHVLSSEPRSLSTDRKHVLATPTPSWLTDKKHLPEAKRHNSPYHGHGKFPERWKTCRSESRFCTSEQVNVRRHSSSENHEVFRRRLNDHYNWVISNGSGLNTKDCDDVTRSESSREVRKKRKEWHSLDQHQKNFQKNKSCLVSEKQRCKNDMKHEDVVRNPQTDKKQEILVATSTKTCHLDFVKKKRDSKSPSLQTTELASTDQFQNNHHVTKASSDSKLGFSTVDPRLTKSEASPVRDVTSTTSTKYQRTISSEAVRSYPRKDRYNGEHTHKSQGQGVGDTKGLARGKQLVHSERGLICSECKESELRDASLKLSCSPSVQKQCSKLKIATSETDTETGGRSCDNRDNSIMTCSPSESGGQVEAVERHGHRCESFKRRYSEISQRHGVNSLGTVNSHDKVNIHSRVDSHGKVNSHGSVHSRGKVNKNGHGSVNSHGEVNSHGSVDSHDKVNSHDTASDQGPGITNSKADVRNKWVDGIEEMDIPSSNKKQTDKERVTTKRLKKDVTSVENKTDVTSVANKTDVTSVENKTDFTNSHDDASLLDSTNICQTTTLSRDSPNSEDIIHPVQNKTRAHLTCAQQFVPGGDVVDGGISEVDGGRSDYYTLVHMPPEDASGPNVSLTDQCQDTSETVVFVDGLLGNELGTGNVVPSERGSNEGSVNTLAVATRLHTPAPHVATRLHTPATPGYAQHADVTNGALKEYDNPNVSRGYTMPNGSYTVPNGGFTVPTGGQTVPNDCYTVPIGGYTVPTGGQRVPNGCKTVPIGGHTVPIDEYTVPIGGYTVPNGGYTMPNGGQTIPNGGYTMPNGSYTVPIDGYTVPNDCYTVPIGGYTVPTGGHRVPNGGKTVPIGGHTVPIDEYTVPNGGYTVPNGGHTIPIDGYTVPNGGYTVPNGGYTVPKRIEFDDYFPELTTTHPSLRAPENNSIYKRVTLEVLTLCHSNDPRRQCLPHNVIAYAQSLSCGVTSERAGQNVCIKDTCPALPIGVHAEKVSAQTNAKLMNLSNETSPGVYGVAKIARLPKSPFSTEIFTQSKLGATGNRPGVAGNRPGVAGNRPGVTGNRTGVAGNRPSCGGGMNQTNGMAFIQKTRRNVKKLPRLYDPIICSHLSKQQTIGILDEFCHVERPISPLLDDECDYFRKPVSFPMFCSGPERVCKSSFPHSVDVLSACPLGNSLKSSCACSLSVPCASALRYGVCEITVVKLFGTLFGRSFLPSPTFDKPSVNMNQSDMGANIGQTPSVNMNQSNIGANIGQTLTHPSSKIAFDFNSRCSFLEGASKTTERLQPNSLKCLCIGSLAQLTGVTPQLTGVTPQLTRVTPQLTAAPQHGGTKIRCVYSDGIQDNGKEEGSCSSLKRKRNVAEIESEDDRWRRQKFAKMDHCGHKKTLLVSAEVNTNNCHHSGSEMADDESSAHQSPPSWRLDDSDNNLESDNFVCDVMSTPIVLSATDRVYDVSKTEPDHEETILDLNSQTQVNIGWKYDSEGDTKREECSSASGSSQDLLARAMDIAGISEKTIDTFLKSDFSIHSFLLNDIYIPPEQEELQCVYKTEDEPSTSGRHTRHIFAHESDNSGISSFLSWDLSSRPLSSEDSKSNDGTSPDVFLDSLFKPEPMYNEYNEYDTTMYAPSTSYQCNDNYVPKITLTTEPGGCNLKFEPAAFCLDNSEPIGLIKKDEVQDSWSDEMFASNEWDGVDLGENCDGVALGESCDGVALGESCDGVDLGESCGRNDVGSLETGWSNLPKECTHDMLDMASESKSLEIWSKNVCTMILSKSHESEGSQDQQLCSITEDPYQISEALELMSSEEPSNTGIGTKIHESHGPGIDGPVRNGPDMDGSNMEPYSNSLKILRRSMRICHKHNYMSGSHRRNSGEDISATGSRRRELLRACLVRDVAPHTRASVRRKKSAPVKMPGKEKKAKKRAAVIPFQARSLICIDETRSASRKTRTRCKNQSVKSESSCSKSECSCSKSECSCSGTTIFCNPTGRAANFDEIYLKANIAIPSCSVQIVPLETHVKETECLNVPGAPEQQNENPGAFQRTHTEEKEPLSVYYENRLASVRKFTKQLTQASPGLLQHVRSVGSLTSYQKVDKISTKTRSPLRLSKRKQTNPGSINSRGRAVPNLLVTDELNCNNNAGENVNSEDSLNTKKVNTSKTTHQLLHRFQQSQVRLPRVCDQSLSLERSKRKLAQLQDKILKRHKELHEAPRSVSFGSDLGLGLNLTHGREPGCDVCAGDRTHSDVASDDNTTVTNACQLPSVTSGKRDRIKVVNFVKRIDSRYGDQLAKGDSNTKLRLNKFCKDYLTLHGVRSRQDHLVKKPKPFESRGGDAFTSRLLLNQESKSVVDRYHSMAQGLVSSDQPCSSTQLDLPGGERPSFAQRVKSASEVNHPAEINSVTQGSVETATAGQPAPKFHNQHEKKTNNKTMKALRPDILNCVNRLTAKPPSPTARLLYQIQGWEKEFGKSLSARDTPPAGNFKNNLSRFCSARSTTGSSSEHYLRGVVATIAASEGTKRSLRGDKKPGKRKGGEKDSLKSVLSEEFSDDDNDDKHVSRDSRDASEPPNLSDSRNDDVITSPSKIPTPPLHVKGGGDKTPNRNTTSCDMTSGMTSCDMSSGSYDQSNYPDLKVIEIEPLSRIKRTVDRSAFSLDFVDLFQQPAEDMFEQSNENESGESVLDNAMILSETVKSQSPMDKKWKHADTETQHGQSDLDKKWKHPDTETQQGQSDLDKKWKHPDTETQQGQSDLDKKWKHPDTETQQCQSHLDKKWKIVDPTVTRYFRNRMPNGGKKVKSLMDEANVSSGNVDKDEISSSIIDDIRQRDPAQGQLIKGDVTDDVNESRDNFMKTPDNDMDDVVIAMSSKVTKSEPTIFPCALPIGILRAGDQDSRAVVSAIIETPRPAESPYSQDLDMLCYDFHELKNCLQDCPTSPECLSNMLDATSVSCLRMSELEGTGQDLCDQMENATSPAPETGHLKLDDWLIREDGTRPESRSSESSVQSPDSGHDVHCDVYRVESLTALKRAIDRQFNTFEDIPNLISLADEKDSNDNTSSSSEETDQDILWSQIGSTGSRSLKLLSPILEDDEEYEMFKNEM